MITALWFEKVRKHATWLLECLRLISWIYVYVTIRPHVSISKSLKEEPQVWKVTLEAC